MPASPATHPASAFDQAFDAWQASARAGQGWRSPATAEAYRRVWQPFAQWCLGQDPPVRWPAVTAQALEAYVLGRSARARADEPVTVRYAWRVLTVVDHVLRHWIGTHPGAGANDAVREVLRRHPAWRWANAPENEALPDHLDATAAGQLLAHLARARRASGDLFTAQARWQSVRDLAVVAVHLGSGVTPAEARALRVADSVATGGRSPGLPWKLRVPASLTVAAREAPLASWAGQVLARWLDVRQREGIGGEWLFPSTRAGKPWSADGHALAVRRVLESAGLEAHWVSGAAYRLRHTFALRQLRRGAAEADLAAWLGVQDAKVMARYRRVLQSPITDVV